MKFQLVLLINLMFAFSEQIEKIQKWRANQDLNPEHMPKTESICQKFISTVYTVEFSAAVEVEKSSVIKLICDSNSKVKKITFLKKIYSSTTCNGVIVRTTDGWYDLTFGGVYGNRETERANLTMRTAVLSKNNGNSALMECSTISSGRCSGDTLLVNALYIADDQNGCSGAGVSKMTAIFRQVEIIGKCASRCNLGSSVLPNGVPINNWGLVDRSASIVKSRK